MPTSRGYAGSCVRASQHLQSTTAVTAIGGYCRQSSTPARCCRVRVSDCTGRTSVADSVKAGCSHTQHNNCQPECKSANWLPYLSKAATRVSARPPAVPTTGPLACSSKAACLAMCVHSANSVFKMVCHCVDDSSNRNTSTQRRYQVKACHRPVACGMSPCSPGEEEQQLIHSLGGIHLRSIGYQLL